MERTESLKNIGAAITLFQTKMQKIKKDATNPFFNSKYATLSTILEHISIPLAEADLSFIQIPDGDCLCTILIHNKSGETVTGCYNIHPTRKDPQGIGSAITYARRYAISAILGLNVDDDDDGNAATTPAKETTAAKESTPVKLEGKKYAEDNRPWLSEKQYQSAMERIIEGEVGLFEMIKKEFRMKKEWNKALYDAYISVNKTK